ncbi:MAG: hypothetical protein ACO3JL_04040 [Myxococcota bacterium]
MSNGHSVESQVSYRVTFPRGAPPLGDVSTHVLADGCQCGWDSSCARPGLHVQHGDDVLEVTERGSLRLADSLVVTLHRAPDAVVVEGPGPAVDLLCGVLRQLGGVTP